MSNLIIHDRDGLGAGCRRPIAIALCLAAAGAGGPATAQCQPEQIAKVLASDGGPSNEFGFSISLDGDTAAIGAVNDNDNGYGSGSVYVFIRQSNGTWVEQAKLTASDGAAGDKFGKEVDLDGDTLVVGAASDDDNGFDSGSAYVFVRSGASWSQQAKLTAADGAATDRFGWDVAVSGDTALIGALDDDDKGTDSGSAYVFVRDGDGLWSQQAKLVAADGASQDQFGHAVDLDGDTAVIGAYLDDDVSTETGSVHVFERTIGPGGAVVWSQQPKLTAGDPLPGDHFGRFLDVDGDMLAIGAPFAHPLNYGAVYVFVRDIDGSWHEEAKLMSQTPLTQHWLGSAVDIEGEVIVAGGAGSGGPESAIAFVRGHDGQGRIRWRQLGELISGDHASLDLLGTAVALGPGFALVGAPWDDDTGSASGSMYVFDLVSSGQTSDDCNGNGTPDCVDIVTGTSGDCNGNGVPDECDIAAGSLDCNLDGVPDECQVFGDTYVRDDGTTESNVGIGGGGNIVWLNQFDVIAPLTEIIEVQVVWGTSLPAGTPATVLVYDDPDNDADPVDAVLLTTAQTTSTSGGGPNYFESVSISPTYVGEPGDSFFVGVFVDQPSGVFPAARDKTLPSAQSSWFIGAAGGTLDLADLAGTATLFGMIDTHGLPGNWMLRARSSHTTDCNGNVVPDDCDIALGTSSDANGNGLPDECECFADISGNGIVGVDDLLLLLSEWGPCPGCTADVNVDGVVDVDDLLLLLAAWGACP